MNYARWQEARAPKTVAANGSFVIRGNMFDYVSGSDPQVCDWYLNFADPELFFGYGTALFAQDEMQVAEHPILGALREALVATGKQAKTIDERLRPTPVTITQVQRRCAIDARGGLYGNAFARAPVEQVREACQPICPPTLSNILAIAAPRGGSGAYTLDQIRDILSTAYTGFSAAKQESQRMCGPEVRTVIHTGFWGCGAFGGNQLLMTAVQALAGDLADVDIVFHAVDNVGAMLAKVGRDTYERFRAASTSTAKILDLILRQGYPWMQPDGN
jgi:hypothetical protein